MQRDFDDVIGSDRQAGRQLRLGWSNRRRGAVHGIGQLQHFQRAGAIGQAADEAAFLQCIDQPVNAGLGSQVERILHLLERRGYATFLQPGLDETQQFLLLEGQHACGPPWNV